MVEEDKIHQAWESIMKCDWKIHKNYGQSYLTPEEYTKQLNNISILRRFKCIGYEERLIIESVIESGRRHYQELREYLYNEPRREAQKYIGNKKIRDIIFNKYGKICLCCGSDNYISLDHIVPVFHGGENSIDNLQPLCRSCNSRKGTNIIDYRL